MSSIYKQEIIEHSQQPHNYGSMENASLEAHEVNTLCGDGIKLFLHIDHEKILDAKFEGNGCAISQASASMLTDELKGMRLEEAKGLSKEFITEMMGLEDINPSRMRCALLSLETLRKALRNV